MCIPTSLHVLEDNEQLGISIDLGAVMLKSVAAQVTLIEDENIQENENLGIDDAALTSPPPISRLLLLPQELFDEITSYLEPTHIVLLALVNKELLGRFLSAHPLPAPLPDYRRSSSSPLSPSSFLSPSPPQPPWTALGSYIRSTETHPPKVRLGVLTALDRDLLDIAYCTQCHRLHSPFLTFADAAYAPRKARSCVDHSGDHHIPPRATQLLLRCIAKHRLRGLPCAHLIRQVNNTTTSCRGGVLGQVSLRLRYRGGDSALLRRRQVVSSVDKTPLSLWLFGLQLEAPNAVYGAARSLPKVHRICNHLVWMDRYALFVDRLLRPLCRRVQRGDFEVHPVHTFACFGTEPYDVALREDHAIAARLAALSLSPSPVVSTSSPGVNPRTQTQVSTNVPPLLGAVRSCDRCTTDFSLDVTPLPAPFHWGFVLTTWMDLGHMGGRHGPGSKWASHLESSPSASASARDFFYRRSADAAPDICERFEGVRESWREEEEEEEDGRVGVGVGVGVGLRPTIHPLDIERICNYGWAERAAAGGGADRYVAWESAHCVDPMTGWILDPDPLDEEDADC